MADRYLDSPQGVDPLEDRINHTIDYLIRLLNSRRAQLLESLRITREEERMEKTRQETISQSEETNMGSEDLSQKTRNPIPSHVQFKWSRKLVESISCFGSVVNEPLGAIDYANLTSAVVTGKFGHAPGELSGPRGIAFHESTHQIYVADCYNSKVEIFSDTGQHVYTLTTDKMQGQHGVAIHKDNLYVLGFWECTVAKFCLNDMSFVKKVGGRGRSNGQFNLPNQLTTDPVGNVYIADNSNHRICVYDSELNHLYNISHPSISNPMDVVISRNHLYVLSRVDNPCVHVLTLTGKKLYSLISCGKDMQLLGPHFFCIDPQRNTVV